MFVPLTFHGWIDCVSVRLPYHPAVRPSVHPVVVVVAELCVVASKNEDHKKKFLHLCKNQKLCRSRCFRLIAGAGLVSTYAIERYIRINYDSY